MTDNKLRCVVVLRIEGKSEAGSDPFGNDDDGMDLTDLSIATSNKAEVTVLAKHDHASQYESSGGAGSGSLYGGRDKDYAEAVSAVISSDPPAGVSEGGSIGGFKVVQSESHQVVYGSDAEGICKSCFQMSICQSSTNSKIFN